MNRFKAQFQSKKIIVALVIAITLLFSFNSPASALSLTEFFSISYTAQFSTNTVTANAPFTVIVTGSANCTKNLETPYNLVSEAVITGRIVAINTATGSKVTLNPGYVLNIKPFPTKAGESASDSQTVSLQFPAGTAPGSYRVEGELVKGEVKAIFWLDVTSYLPDTKTLGTVSYAMETVQSGGGGGGGGGGGSTPTPTPTTTPTPTPTLSSSPSPTPTPTNIIQVIDATGKSLSSYLNSEGSTTSPLKIQSAGQTCATIVNRGTKIQFPQGVPNIITVKTSVSPPTKSTVKLLDTVYELGPDGTTFDPAITLTIDFSKVVIHAGASVKDLVIFNWDPVYNYWVPLTCTLDESNKTISTSIGHFSLYTILPNVISSSTPITTSTPVITPQPTSKPAAFSFANLSAIPDKVNVNEPVNIKFNITNTGNQPGNCRVELKLDGNLLETREVSLKEGDMQTIFFIVSKPVIGNHTVTVDKLSVNFQVLQTNSLSTIDWWLWVIIIATVVVIGATSAVVLSRKRH